MNKKIILIPIIIIVGIIGFTLSTNQIEQIDEGKIIEKKIFEEIKPQEIKTDEEIFKEIDEKYRKIDEMKNVTSYQVLPREWQTSGPFSIDRNEYALGEKIFFRADGLNMNDSGQISILRQMNQTHYVVWKTYPFDGQIADSFNVYFQPSLSKVSDICDKNDLIGDWVIVFKNTNFDNLRFSINDKIVTGDENDYQTSVC